MATEENPRVIKHLNAIIHMSLWSSLFGIVTALTGAMMLDGIDSIGAPVLTILCAFGGFIPFALAAAVVGIATGAFIRDYLRPLMIPFTDSELKALTKRVYLGAFFVPLGFVGLFSFPIAAWQGSSSNLAEMWMLITLTVLFSALSVFGAHHYLMRLKKYNLGSGSKSKKRKSKGLQDIDVSDIDAYFEEEDAQQRIDRQ